jgi:predicted GNAT family acetyltransferase
MSWHRIEPDELPALERFVRRHELSAVAAAAWLREKSPSAQLLRRDPEIYLRCSDRASEINPEGNSAPPAGKQETGKPVPSEAVIVTEYGLVLPLLEKSAPGRDRHDLAALLQGCPRQIGSIMGLAHRVLEIERLLGKPVRTAVDYFLMDISAPDAMQAARAVRSGPLPENVRIRQAQESEAIPLFALQKQYELEEVYVDKSRFSQLASFTYFKNCLRKEIVLVAEKNGRAVAKGGTNARGFNACQIGGVYTVPEERRRGLARLLMAELLERIAAQGKSTCLFVKQANTAAVNLYRSLGFHFYDYFRISYLEDD